MAAQACRDCRTVCGKGKVTMENMVKMEEAYEILEKGQSESLLKKHLKRNVFDKLKELQTPLGSTLLDCIQSGVHNLDSGIGVYAADKDAYAVFRELFDPIIEEYHRFKSTQKHPKANWGNPCDLTAIDPDGKYVISTRVRCGRNVEGFNFNPTMTEQQYADLEKKISNALNSLQGDLKGTYYALKSMSKTEQQKLIDDHFLFKEGDRFLQAGNACRFWPKGRGIFYTPKKTFLVWVGEEDHMRLISMQSGGNLREVYKRLMDGVSEIENLIEFSHSDRLGYLTFCPTNLGTTIRASVHIKLPKLSKDMNKMESLATRYNLQIRGSAGEHSESPTGVYDISNKRRLGLTEFEAIKEMNDGILALIKEEESM